MTTPEDILNDETSIGNDDPSTNDDLQSKRESLSILACLGATKEYTGTEMDLKAITKLSEKDVEKYYKRYQVVSGKKIADGLVDPALQLIAHTIARFVNLDDKEALILDWKNDQLIRKEISEISGLLVLRGGRLTALLSAAIHIAKHFKTREPAKPIITENVGVDTVH